MQPTRCKFKCNSTNQQNYPGGVINYQAQLAPVYSSDPASENKAFWDATPSGTFEITTTKFQPFEAGKEYYIDISLAE